jgi:hypothetical protein
MLIFSLRDAAKIAGTSKSTIWRAIRARRSEAGRTEFGGFVIDPADLLRVYPEKKVLVSAGQSARQDETDRQENRAVRTAILETELHALRAMAEELRQSREAWQLGAERATAALIGLATNAAAR